MTIPTKRLHFLNFVLQLQFILFLFLFFKQYFKPLLKYLILKYLEFRSYFFFRYMAVSNNYLYNLNQVLSPSTTHLIYRVRIKFFRLKIFFHLIILIKSQTPYCCSRWVKNSYHSCLT